MFNVEMVLHIGQVPMLVYNTVEIRFTINISLLVFFLSTWRSTLYTLMDLSVHSKQPKPSAIILVTSYDD